MFLPTTLKLLSQLFVSCAVSVKGKIVFLCLIGSRIYLCPAQSLGLLWLFVYHWQNEELLLQATVKGFFLKERDDV